MWGWQTLISVPALDGTATRAPISTAVPWNIQIIWNLTGQKDGSPIHRNKEPSFLFHSNRRTFNSEMPRLAGQFVTPLPAAYATLNHDCTNDGLIQPPRSPCKTTSKRHVPVWACDNRWSNRTDGKTACGRNDCFSWAPQQIDPACSAPACYPIPMPTACATNVNWRPLSSRKAMI